MRENQAVLAANAAFYEAFAKGDAEAMVALWARRAPVACIHPGWTPLVGRDTVIESWQAIFDHDPPAIQFDGVQVHLLGDAAYVTCYEILDEALLAATNIFVREDGEWRMVHHHAGPAALEAAEEGEDSDEPEPPVTLH